MPSPGPREEEPSSFRPFTKAERIQQLNEIDKSITQLLQSAGLAIKTLTASQSTSSSEISPVDRRDAFQAASNSYLRTLQSVDVRLRRQIYGLEEADIIPADKAKTKGKGDGRDPLGTGKPGPNNAAAGEATVVESGLGKFDIGWLNSRSGRVGRDMEAEQWAKARKFLEVLENGRPHRADDGETIVGAGDEDLGS